jgi:hypothetical protein
MLTVSSQSFAVMVGESMYVKPMDNPKILKYPLSMFH